jgi:hypothetical protein
MLSNFMSYQNYIVLLFLCIIFACSCGGRVSNPVTIKRDHDQELTCKQIEYEVFQIRKDITTLFSQAAKGRKKSTIISLMSILSPLGPLSNLFSDVRKADKVEINALQKRHNRIVMIAQKKGCGEGKFLLSTETKCKDFYTLDCFIPFGKK